MADFMVASVCYSFFAMKYDLARFPHFQKWLMASLERPKAKEARALRE
jgi:glutathione S-transferase